MKTCAKCNKEFKTCGVIDGKAKNFGNRKFCLTCSPFGTHNTRDITSYQRDNSERQCARCGRTYTPDKAKGHNRLRCNSCLQRVRQDQKRAILLAVFGRKCLLCGYDKCPSAIDYHHVNPQEKDFNIGSGLNRNIDELINEVDKCITACARCHREIHAGIISQETVLASWVGRVKAPLLQGGDAGFDPQNSHKAT